MPQNCFQTVLLANVFQCCVGFACPINNLCIGMQMVNYYSPPSKGKKNGYEWFYIFNFIQFESFSMNYILLCSCWPWNKSIWMDGKIRTTIWCHEYLQMYVKHNFIHGFQLRLHHVCSTYEWMNEWIQIGLTTFDRWDATCSRKMLKNQTNKKKSHKGNIYSHEFPYKKTHANQTKSEYVYVYFNVV